MGMEHNEVQARITGRPETVAWLVDYLKQAMPKLRAGAALPATGDNVVRYLVLPTPVAEPAPRRAYNGLPAPSMGIVT